MNSMSQDSISEMEETLNELFCASSQCNRFLYIITISDSCVDYQED